MVSHASIGNYADLPQGGVAVIDEGRLELAEVSEEVDDLTWGNQQNCRL